MAVAKQAISPSMKLIKKTASTQTEVDNTNVAASEGGDEGVQTLTKAPAKKASTVKKTVKPAPKAEEAEEQVEMMDKPEEEGEELTASGDMIVNTAHEIENLKEDKAFKLVPQLLNNIDHDYFRLGGVLAVIQSQGWYMDRSYENFRGYVEAECGIAYRKAMYLVGIYNGLVESKVPWDTVKHLGWTKLKELAPLITPENVDEWVGIAENMTVLQLQEHIKAKSEGTAIGGDEPSTDDAKKTTTMTFKLHEDQKATIREALEKAKHETGTEVDTAALEFICLDYLSGDKKLKKVPTLAELMKSKSAEEVLTIFGDVFPDVGLEATLPEED